MSAEVQRSVIFLQSGTRQALHHALSLAMTAVSLGEEVTIALFWDGLRAWTHDAAALGFGDGGAATWQAGFDRLQIPSPASMVETIREIGGARFTVLACGASVEALGERHEVLLDQGIDDVVGLPTIWRRARGARVLTV